MQKTSPLFTALLLMTVLLIFGLVTANAEGGDSIASFDEAYAAYKDYLPGIPIVDNVDSMSVQDRTNAFMETIQNRSDELGLFYTEWSLADKAWLSNVAKAYNVKAFKEEFVLPIGGDCPEDEAVEKAREALSKVMDSDTRSLTLSYVTFSIRDGEQEPVWHVCFEVTEHVYLDRHGKVLDAQVNPAETPAPDQITQEKALEIVKGYLVDKLRFSAGDVEKLRFDPHFYLKNADNPCDYFLIHCYQGEEFTSVYVNADTGEVYKVGLPGLGNG